MTPPLLLPARRLVHAAAGRRPRAQRRRARDRRGAGGRVRIGLACEAGPPPAEVLELLEAAGLPAASLREEAPPALLRHDAGLWLLGPAGDVLRACDRGALDAGVVGRDRLLEGTPRRRATCSTCAGAATSWCSPSCRAAGPSAGCASPRATPRPPAATSPPRARSRTSSPWTSRRWLRRSGSPTGSSSCAPGWRRGCRGAPPLEVREVVAACSARLVAARAARVLLRDEFSALVTRLRAALEDDMRHLPWNDDLAATVAALRALAPPPAEVQAAVAAIVADVRARGDDAVRAHTARLDGVELPEDYAVPPASCGPAGRAVAGPARRRSRWPPPTSAPTTSARRSRLARDAARRARSSARRSCRSPPPASTCPAASPTTRRRCS